MSTNIPRDRIYARANDALSDDAQLSLNAFDPFTREVSPREPGDEERRG